MTGQSSFDIGTEHVCGHDVATLRQCGQVYRCDEADCVAPRKEQCTACTGYQLRHSAYWGNRAKRDPVIAEKLQRMAAIAAAADHRSAQRGVA